MLHSASRYALDELRQREHEVFEGRISSDSLAILANELYAVAQILIRQPQLRRLLADPATEADSRSELATRIFGDQLGRNTMTVLDAAIRLRWSSPWDFVDALEKSGDDAIFRAAEKDGNLDSLEDELFRLERILLNQGNVVALLDEQAVPAARRLELLDSLVEGKVLPATLTLLRNAVSSDRKRSIVLAIDDLLDEAARWQERSVARVVSAVALSAEQLDRLTAVLSTIYGRQIVPRVAIDPAVRGGLVIRVGDEEIDGSVTAKLAAVRDALTT